MAQGTHVEEGTKPRKRRVLLNIILTLMMLSGLYNIAVFSNIPFVEKWREIYIETAMGTMTHQWMATAIIPKRIIDQVMDERYSVENEQSQLNTGEWHISQPKDDPTQTWEKLKNEINKLYPEIEMSSLNKYITDHNDALDSNGYLWIDKAGLDDKDTGIRTVHGDRVLALDTRNGIIILMRKSGDYVARMAIIKKPEQVGVRLAPEYGKVGATIADICKNNKAILGINASGFYDPEGHGNGAEAFGYMKANGKEYSPSSGSNYKMLGFDNKNALCIGNYKDTGFFRDAVEFKPVLVLNGKQKVEGSAGWGIQPRSAIGQKKTGDVLLLIVDGRQPGYSIGAEMGDLAKMMLDYNAEQAINLDGGSSSVMYYNGRLISKPSSADKNNGRRLPNGFLVFPQK